MEVFLSLFVSVVYTMSEIQAVLLSGRSTPSDVYGITTTTVVAVTGGVPRNHVGCTKLGIDGRQVWQKVGQ